MVGSRHAPSTDRLRAGRSGWTVISRTVVVATGPGRGHDAFPIARPGRRPGACRPARACSTGPPSGLARRSGRRPATRPVKSPGRLEVARGVAAGDGQGWSGRRAGDERGGRRSWSGPRVEPGVRSAASSLRWWRMGHPLPHLHRSAPPGSASGQGFGDPDRLVAPERGLQPVGDRPVRPEQDVADPAARVVHEAVRSLPPEDVGIAAQPEAAAAGDPARARRSSWRRSSC